MPSVIEHRLTVLNVVCDVYWEDMESFMFDRDLSRDEIKECVIFCKEKACINGSETTFCDGCFLDNITTDSKLDLDDFVEKEVASNEFITVSKDGLIIFLGKKDEMENALIGVAGWKSQKKCF